MQCLCTNAMNIVGVGKEFNVYFCKFCNSIAKEYDDKNNSIVYITDTNFIIESNTKHDTKTKSN